MYLIKWNGFLELRKYTGSCFCLSLLFLQNKKYLKLLKGLIWLY